jgi:hypothetical protein
MKSLLYYIIQVWIKQGHFYQVIKLPINKRTITRTGGFKICKKKKKKQNSIQSGQSLRRHPPGTTMFYWFHGKVKDPPIVELAEGGLIATQRREMVMAISPDHTKTIVGVLPLLPISPFANG